MTPEIIEATERADDLLALWREQRRLSHRIRLAKMRFEMVGYDPDEVEGIAHEVANWKSLVRAFAESRRAA